jgi:hypothetical protein
MLRPEDAEFVRHFMHYLEHKGVNNMRLLSPDSIEAFLTDYLSTRPYEEDKE